MSKNNIVRFCVSIPKSLLEKFNEVSREIGFANRSEAIRSAIRLLISSYEETMGSEGNIGVIAIIYPHGKNLEEIVTGKQHEHEDVVMGASHYHLGENCLEVIVCKGSSDKIKELYKELKSINGVLSCSLTLLGTP